MESDLRNVVIYTTQMLTDDGPDQLDAAINAIESAGGIIISSESFSSQQRGTVHIQFRVDDSDRTIRRTPQRICLAVDEQIMRAFEARNKKLLCLTTYSAPTHQDAKIVIEAVVLLTDDHYALQNATAVFGRNGLTIVSQRFRTSHESPFGKAYFSATISVGFCSAEAVQCVRNMWRAAIGKDLSAAPGVIRVELIRLRYYADQTDVPLNGGTENPVDEDYFDLPDSPRDNQRSEKADEGIEDDSGPRWDDELDSKDFPFGP